MSQDQNLTRRKVQNVYDGNKPQCPLIVEQIIDYLACLTPPPPQQNASRGSRCNNKNVKHPLEGVTILC